MPPASVIDFSAAVRAPRSAGRVVLAGAGAGEAGLLTLAARDALKAADVVLYDDLVDPSVLALIPAHVERLAVGKRAGQPSTPQGEIVAALIGHARAGRSVVRLKGGDPFIFGRGGEETEALAAAGIAVEIIPGITAALTAAASAGIPLTHRGVSTAVSLVTAVTRDGELPDLRGLAGPNRTLVVYMGRDAADRVAAALIADRVPAETSVAAIENAGRSSQRVAVATLETLATTLAVLAPTGPTLLIVGAVVDHRIATSPPAGTEPLPADLYFAHG
ncbi:MAG: uroporphyrinogen-III C-methyltransferase [Rhodospirillaceae bacterium]|nr:uroporphyrinogen-III C-methyltransferase [Rhodospirillaceae bacterium]